MKFSWHLNIVISRFDWTLVFLTRPIGVCSVPVSLLTLPHYSAGRKNTFLKTLGAVTPLCQAKAILWKCLAQSVCTPAGGAAGQACYLWVGLKAIGMPKNNLHVPSSVLNSRNSRTTKSRRLITRTSSGCSMELQIWRWQMKEWGRWSMDNVA